MAKALWWALGWAAVWCSAAIGAENRVRNPSFETRDEKGLPADWHVSGNRQRVEQSLALDTGRDGQRCARLSCTRFQGGTPDSHAMIAQSGVAVKQGMAYRLTFWAKSEGLDGDVAHAAISDTADWQNCGLEESFAPTADWNRFEFFFRATRTCDKSTRFQIWFNSTGTLWLDDVELVEAGRDFFRPGRILPAAGVVNLVPNASFECGADGWGSAEGDRMVHWGGRMNRLFGEIDATQACDGQASLRIAMTPETQPVSFFDYYELTRAPIRVPLAGNIGFMEVEPGHPYTFSASMKADRPGTPARLRVVQFQAGSIDRGVRLGTDWERHRLTFTPRARWCYVLAGPDLAPSRQTPEPPRQATVWLDAVQLEKGDQPSAFRVRTPVEFGLSTDRPGNVFDWDEPVRVDVAVHRAEAENQPAALRLIWTDFFDQDLPGEPGEIEVPPGRNVRLSVRLGASGARGRGFLRLRAVLTAGPHTETRTLRLAVIPSFRGQDSRFGVNHAYPWPHLVDLSRKAGLLWVRDWSLKWQEVEPEKGVFRFTETDFQIDRPRKHGLEVLGLLPFPSSNWSSSAPASVRGAGPYPQNRARVAYAPREESEFESYVAATVSHYSGRIRWWQVFNEPLFTDYSLPRGHGYDGKTYARLVQAFARAARRANPDCRVLAGIGYLQEGQILDDFETFFAAGGLAACDAIDIHHYPRIRPPEFLEQLLEKLNALMDKHGGRKPIWLTEYGYYADDEPAVLPLEHHGFDQSVGSERLQAEYAVRWAAIGLAHGIEKIFYHAGTCHPLNGDNMQGVFYKYGGEPRRIYAVQAVLARLLTPQTRFVKKLRLGEGARGYLFREGARLVAVVWATGGARPAVIRLADARIQVWDVMGRPSSQDRFTASGSPVYLLAQGVSDEAFASGLEVNPSP